MDVLNKIAEKLKKKNADAIVVADKNAALEALKEMIPEGSTVGLGGSTSLSEIGGLDFLRSGKFELFDQYKEGLSREENLALRKKGLTANYFVTGSNAITEEGVMVNIDGFGNRVAAQIYGPEHLILIIGKNKVVPTIDAAMERAQEFAAPTNAKRFDLNIPCKKTGKCHDCDSPERICNFYTIIKRFPAPGRVRIILVNEDLGY